MDFEFFSEQIMMNYRNGDYKAVVRDINKYLENKYGMVDWLLDIYVDSLIKIRALDDALKCIHFMDNYFKGFYDENDMACKYMMCNKLDDAEKILVNSEFTIDKCFNLGKVYFLQRKYLKAKEQFLLYIKNSTDELYISKAKKYLFNIENYLKFGAFCECSYQAFKESGDKLLPGHVIYLKSNIDEQLNGNYSDVKKFNRPFMIYKIVDEKIYCFPVTTKVESRKCYILYAYKYPNIGVDRKLKDNLNVFCTDDVDKVVDYIRPNDYRNALIDLYKCFYLRKNEISSLESNVFMKDMLVAMNVCIGDVINFYDTNTKKKSFHFVIGMNENGYETILVDTNDYVNFIVLDDNITNISKNTYVFRAIKLDEIYRESIYGQLNKFLSVKNVKKLKRC